MVKPSPKDPKNPKEKVPKDTPDSLAEGGDTGHGNPPPPPPPPTGG